MINDEQSIMDNFDVSIEWNEKIKLYNWIACGNITIESTPTFFKEMFDCKKDWERFALEYSIKNWKWC